MSRVKVLRRIPEALSQRRTQALSRKTLAYLRTREHFSKKKNLTYAAGPFVVGCAARGLQRIPISKRKTNLEKRFKKMKILATKNLKTTKFSAPRGSQSSALIFYERVLHYVRKRQASPRPTLLVLVKSIF